MSFQQAIYQCEHGHKVIVSVFREELVNPEYVQELKDRTVKDQFGHLAKLSSLPDGLCQFCGKPGHCGHEYLPGVGWVTFPTIYKW